MGLLKQGINTSTEKVSYCSNALAEKFQSELEKLKTLIDYYLKYLSEVSVIKSACLNVQQLIDQIKNLKIMLWSKEKAYMSYQFLARQIAFLLSQISSYTSIPATYAYDALRDIHCKLLNFIVVSFSKIDEDLVTPVCYKTAKGGVFVYESTKSGYGKTKEIALNKVIVPTLTCVDGTLYQPLKSRSIGAGKCVLSTGAWCDTKFQLSEMLLAVANYSQSYDQKYTGGYVYTKGEALLTKAMDVDEKFTGGNVSEAAKKVYDEYDACKRRASTTSA